MKYDHAGKNYLRRAENTPADWVVFWLVGAAFTAMVLLPIWAS